MIPSMQHHDRVYGNSTAAYELCPLCHAEHPYGYTLLCTAVLARRLDELEQLLQAHMRGAAGKENDTNDTI